MHILGDISQFFGLFYPVFSRFEYNLILTNLFTTFFYYDHNKGIKQCLKYSVTWTRKADIISIHHMIYTFSINIATHFVVNEIL